MVNAPQDNSQDMEVTWMSINSAMDKEDEIHIHNEIFFSHKQQQKCAICRDVDGPRDSNTEWSKLGKEKQVSCFNACMWDLQK